MRHFIFITAEGTTFQPDSESTEPDIENCQVIGFSSGTDSGDAFHNMVEENPCLLDTAFNELIAYELLHETGTLQHFCLDDARGDNLPDRMPVVEKQSELKGTAEEYLRIYYVPGSYGIYGFDIVGFNDEGERENYYDEGDGSDFFRPAHDLLVDKKLFPMLLKICREIGRRTDRE